MFETFAAKDAVPQGTADMTPQPECSGWSRLVRVLAVAMVAASLGACSSFDVFSKKDDTPPDEPADRLYNEGLYLLNAKKDARDAVKKFEEVDRQHPYSEWARKSLLMTAYAGVVTAVPTVNTSPKEFAPTMQGGLQWSRWGMFVESKGTKGEKCDMPSACQLMDYLKEWELPKTRARLVKKSRFWFSSASAKRIGISGGSISMPNTPIPPRCWRV